MPLHGEVHGGKYCNVEWPIRESLVQNYGSFGLEQRRIRIGSCGEGGNRRNGVAGGIPIMRLHHQDGLNTDRTGKPVYSVNQLFICGMNLSKNLMHN